MTVENVELVNTNTQESHLAVSVLSLGSHPNSVVWAVGWAQFDPYSTEPTANVGQHVLSWQDQPKRIISEGAVQELLKAGGLVRAALVQPSVPLSKAVASIKSAVTDHNVSTVWMYRTDVQAFEHLLSEAEVSHPLDGLELMDPPSAFKAIARITGRAMPVRDEVKYEPQYSVIGDVAWLVRAVREMYNPSPSEHGVRKV